MYSSEGRNIFEEAGEELVFARTQRIEEDGEHLIEILSDMQAEVLVRVNLQE
jgi:hypothetical protein